MNSAECPVRGKRTEDTTCPLNNMPSEDILHNVTSLEGESLSTDRESSSIPRDDANTKWLYPSPKMFYNALHRKGKGVNSEYIKSMLFIHNQLNESVWNEIVKREQYLAPECSPNIKLKRFQGRPEDLSPTAWWHVNVSKGQAPFDRHDWIIDRCGREIRYVIDYYSGHSKDGDASFYVDIRPAIDTSKSLLDRFWLFWRDKFTENN